MMIKSAGIANQKTKQVVFEEAFTANDPKTLAELQELSSKRKAIEESINESRSITEAIAREMSGGLTSRYEQDIQKLEQYLPLLENLLYHAYKNQVAHCIPGLKISWCSSLISSFFFQFKGTKYFEIPDLRFELGMVLFIYGGMIRERALEVLQIDLVQSATLLRKAAGVYQYLALEVLPLLQPELAAERPPECMTKVSSAMSLLCLAEVQAVTARKAEGKGTTPSLLAKLHCGVRDFLNEALGILQSVSKECKYFSSRLMDFITSNRVLHELKSFKYLAESLMIEGKIGAAIGILRRVVAHLETNTPKEESWRSVFEEVKEELTKLLKKYERENEIVWYEKIPDHLDICPEPKKIVDSIPYQSQRSNTILDFVIYGENCLTQ